MFALGAFANTLMQKISCCEAIKITGFEFFALFEAAGGLLFVLVWVLF